MASAPNPQVAHHIRNRDQHFRERIGRLKTIQGYELQWDDGLLRGAVPPPGPDDYGLTGNLGLAGLNFNHIFESLSRRFSQKFGEDMRVEMVKRVNDLLFIMELGAPTFEEDMQFTMLPEWTAIKILQKEALAGLRKWTSMEGASWGSASDVKILFDFINILTVMRRFADGRNPEVAEKPLPDGSNIIHPDLRVSWAVHRAWIRLLHYRGLKLGQESFGIAQLIHVLEVVNTLYYEEILNVSPNPTENRVTYEEFHQIDDMIDLVHGKIAAIADQLHQERVWPLGRVENPAKFLEIAQRNFGSSPQDQTLRLWALLLKLNAELEDRLRKEHVEDVMIYKRVLLDDEWWNIHNKLADDNEYDPAELLANWEADGLEDAESIIRKIGQINSLRRNYHLLRDWNHKRPWKQLYHLIDTTDNGIDRMYREPISAFYAYIRSLEQIHEPHLAEGSPSRKANIWSSLFPIHPIGLHGPEPSIPQLDDNCTVCMEGFEVTQKHPVIARLHCNHLFHFTCIRSYWDHSQKVQMNCPLCGPTTVWALSSTAAITPEAVDVWDNVAVVGNEYAATHPDISDLWMTQQEGQMFLSLAWNMNEETRNQIRIAGVEISILRASRWKNNQDRRREARDFEEAINSTRSHRFSI